MTVAPPEADLDPALPSPYIPEDTDLRDFSIRAVNAGVLFGGRGGPPLQFVVR